MTNEQLWDRFKSYYTEFENLGLALDLSRMNFDDGYLSRSEPLIQRAFATMADLERGTIANPNENRMVGHYWLRNPGLAPTGALRSAIENTILDIKQFAKAVHEERIRGARGPFKYLLIIGIGGSALGPQFVAQALGHPQSDRLKPCFFDNTDPDGFDRVLVELTPHLGQTLCLVISKSGGTKETRNGMLEAKHAYEKAHYDFAKHAVAITGKESDLDRYATAQSWIRRFPMWDWVGGRTSETSAVGLLPAALQGIDIDLLLAGAKACDEATREPCVKANPAAQLALMWYYATEGRGTKSMVLLPYKDRLGLFSKYLQQLVMESIGKEFDLQEHVVNQGLTVFGNKGSTDQHAYVQQLREGPNQFFITFIEVLRQRNGESIQVEPQITSGDYLNGFLTGTRQALFEKGRESITITINDVTPFSIGVLIALYERAVGFYASLVNINAYHQPGVEAGKKAATTVLQTQLNVLSYLQAHATQAFTVAQIASGLGMGTDCEVVFKICERLAANPDRKIKKNRAQTPFLSTYSCQS